MIKFILGFVSGAITVGIISIAMFFKIGYDLEDEIYEEARKEYQRGFCIDDEEDAY